MKCNAAIAALMLAMGLSTPSFGATLLDQMLGMRSSGHGCCATPCCPAPCCEPACCPAPCCEPTCCPAPCCDTNCCDAGHGGGLLRAHRYPAPCCDQGCCPPACGCEPACGAAPCCEQTCCPPACGTGHGCAPACGCDHGCAPACGCDAGCCDSCCPTPCCARKRTSLLDLIFGNRHKSCCAPACCAPSCCYDSCGGHAAPYGGGAPSPAADDSAPVPPAPMVDPAAYVPAQRRVVHAGVNLLR